MTDLSHPSQPLCKYPALILSGGRSRRMGQDKALLPLGKETVLQRVEKAFSQLSPYRVLVIGHDATEPKGCNFQAIIRDQNPDAGPLEGLRVGLDFLSEYPLVFVGTCDAPLVVPQVYRAMASKLDSAVDAVVPKIHGQVYPLTAVYRTGVKSFITSMVQQQQLRVKDLLNAIKTCDFSADEFTALDPTYQTLRNINTQGEYRELLKELQAK